MKMRAEVPLVPMGEPAPPDVYFVKVVAADYNWWLEWAESLRKQVDGEKFDWGALQELRKASD